MYTLGVDIGGTFTDVLLIGDDGSRFRSKVLTTPDDLVRSCMNGVRAVMSQAGITGESIRRAVHATTQATNTLTERRREPVALLVTKGFRDLVPVSGVRGGSRDTFDLLWDKWEPPTSRELIFEVPERMGAGGIEVTPLNEQAVRDIAVTLRATRASAVAVCFLHSYAWPEHELRVKELLAEELGPDVYIASSAEVWPEYMELQRWYATLFTAYVGPVMSDYLLRFEAGLTNAGFGGELQVMQSGGGVMSARRALVRPLLSIESGPSAGALAAGYVGARSGYAPLLSFDMGGTTAKAAYIADAKPQIRQEFEVGGHAAGGGEESGGVVLRMPAVDLVEVGAGGGSIAWIDDGGVLQVGPQSANADPGPAAYGLGGKAATVTDANLLLGYLSPDYFLGGDMKLDLDAARAAVGEVAARTGGTLIDTAAAIHQIANLMMGNAIRLVTLSRGNDPARCRLLAFGGAGPMHAATLADAFHISEVIIPCLPGVFSTLGLVTSDMELENVAPLWLSLDEVNPAQLEAHFDRLERPLLDELARSGFMSEDIVVHRALDMRYKSQGFDLAVPVDGPIVTVDLRSRYESQYAGEYEVRRDGVPIIVRACRVRAVGVVRDSWPATTSGGTKPVRSKSSRSVFDFALGDYRETPVFDRDDLRPGDPLVGPAIVEERESTTVVPSGWTVLLDPEGNLVLRRD